jgi:hypothetical protein
VANIDVIAMVIVVVTCVIGLVLFGTFYLNKTLDQDAR